MEFGGYKGTGPRVRVRRRAELGRRLTRRLSLVAKMPAAILSKANPPEPRPVEITAIAPDKTQLTVSKRYETHSTIYPFEFSSVSRTVARRIRNSTIDFAPCTCNTLAAVLRLIEILEHCDLI